MAEYKLKTGPVEKKVVEAYKKVENGAVGAYKAVEDGVVGAYKRVENAFVETFLERVDTPDAQEQAAESKAPAEDASAADQP